MADPDFKPFRSIHEFLTAVHIYADEARHGKTRYVDAMHYCAHTRKDLRQCLIYDSHEENARLIGIEYMVPKEVYDSFDEEEQKLWHSHDFEVKSGMLILPKPSGYTDEEWEQAELEAMKEIVHLYGKTWHTWQVDAGHEFPLGRPALMGSATSPEQIDLDTAMTKRNQAFGVDHRKKAAARRDIQPHHIHPNANSWWKND
ncbi:hypothetical protein PMZ80_011147 [Knufia obscura]|uniref:DUF1264-domain-containing protein n=1 Tax=Knufia obscura TaxID=1635080 RepID=A0ABR0R8U9_9EURO|nr:hypothetical protein PMZ80_011147 [Knufia obscura]